MVKRILKLAEKAAGKAKSVLFADPKLLYSEERHLVSEPFFFEGTNGKGVLLVHGWTSTPYELRRLGKYLNENGYTVSGIQLSGHGTVPKDLENVKWPVWVEDIKAGYNQLNKKCDKVYVAGTSIGSNLSLMLAKDNSEIAGLILMATPYKIKVEWALNFFKLFTPLILKMGLNYRKKFYPPTFGLSTTVTRLISYQAYPLTSALESFELIKECRKHLNKISQPCFILQSTHDHLVHKKSMERIYEKIGSTTKQKKYIEKAYHTFISDIRNEHVFADILNFLNEN